MSMSFKPLLLVVAAALASGQDFDAYLAREAAAQRFSGAVLVARDGKPLFAKGYGMANREWDIPNTPDTKFRLGSISKMFAAAAVLKLEEAGKLKTSDPVCSFIENCPVVWTPITVHHLLTHSSGIWNFTNDPEYPKTWMLPSRPLQTMQRFRDKPLQFAPGTQFRYSNSGYVLLAAIVEKASSSKYEDYLKKTIFEPLGMSDTASDAWTPVLKKRASGYSRGWVNAPYHDMTIPLGGGDLYSTVHDLLKWDQALYGNTLLSDESKRKMWSIHRGDYGYGWVLGAWEGKPQQAHGGGINGFSTFLRRMPEDRMLIVVLENADFLNAGATAHVLTRLAYGLPEKAEFKEISVAAERLKDYVGVYQMEGTPVTNTITLKDGQLTTQLAGQQAFPLFPFAPEKFFLKVVDAQVEFERDAGGAVTALYIIQGGGRTKAVRKQ
jgi:CubicO group peptidase (beta-lactamase class C family)